MNIGVEMLHRRFEYLNSAMPFSLD